MLYLDNASTTKPYKEVIEEVIKVMKFYWGNPSSLYSLGKDTKEIIDKARQNIAKSINAKQDEIIFTSGGSESNCTVLQGFVNYWESRGYTPVVITSTIEHKSILECIENGNIYDLSYVGVDKFGKIDKNALVNLLRLLRKKSERYKILVSIQFANNEIGTIQDIKSLSRIAHDYDAVFHTDAVQAYGNINIDVDELGIDLMSVSGHKIGMMKGIGFLYKRKSIYLKPIIYGTQEYGLRGGTENVPYIAGLSKAVDITFSTKEERIKKLKEKHIMLIKKMIDGGIEGTVNGSFKNRLINNISLTLKENVIAESLIYSLDSSNIYISSGSACNSRSQNPSHVLKAIGLSDEKAHRTIRITFNDNLKECDADRFVVELKKAIEVSKAIYLN